MDFKELNLARRSHRDFDPGIKITRPTLEHILNEAALAPTSFNMQGYGVIAVLTDEEKKRLHPLSWNQPQVLSASAVLIILGNVEAYKGLRHIMEQSPSVPAAYVESAVKMATGSYSSNERMARDEAIRSVGLFSMNLMHAALNEGYETGPMIGFDADGISKAFNVQHPYFPALMISLGKVTKTPYPRGYRVPASEFTRFI